MFTVWRPVCLEAFLHAPIFIFLCIVVSGLLAECRLDWTEISRKANHEAAWPLLKWRWTAKFFAPLHFLDSLVICRTIVDRLYLLISSELKTSEVSLAFCRLSFEQAVQMMR
jgi:hypothetical protein